jgi:predicted restriction endonuclease
VLMPFQKGHGRLRTDESYRLGGIKIAKNPNSKRTQFVKGIEPWSKSQKGVHLSPKSEFKIGENNPRWKGGITPEIMKARGSIRYKKWRSRVFRRDGYKCKKCGDDRGGNLHAHHIKFFSLYPKLRYVTNNGITLCKICHRAIHRKK